MKILLFLTFLYLCSSNVTAQTVPFNVQGTIQQADKAKYAYLIGSSTDLFLVQSVRDAKFEFSGTYLPQGIFYPGVFIFLSEEGNYKIEELKAKSKIEAWVLGRTPEAKFLVLEDLKFDIAGKDKVNTATIIAGGVLNKQYEEMKQAKRDRNIKRYILKYPDSPFNIGPIESIIRAMGLPGDLNEIERKWGGAAKDLYSLLSDRLKNSKEGIELKKRMDEAYSER
jgi:hypothetical protein